jgi:carbon-monoxide dehydrogenase medium subunit
VPFDYHEPATLAETFALLDGDAGETAILAGGTDLLLQMRRRLRHYKSVINIKRVPGLDTLSFDSANGLTCGALVTMRALETDATVRATYPALAEAAEVVAGVQLRNLATIGGNIGNASPSADTVPPLVALAATVTVEGPGGTRTLAIENCFAGPGRTVFAHNEVIRSLQVPAPPAQSGSAYERFTPRSAMDIAVVSVAAFVALDASGRCADCRIALGAVSPVPLRATAAEDAMRGQSITPQLIEQAGALAGVAAEPITDIRGSAEYRRALVGVLTRRVVALAAQRAAGANGLSGPR